MATIREREGKDGKMTYNVMIRKKGVEISKTFFTEEDAELYEWYKERLLQNMDAFDVPINERVTLEQLCELKVASLPEETDFRTKLHFESSLDRITTYLGKDKFLCNFTYEDWLECAKKVAEMDVYRGTKTEKNKRKMSVKTLRNIFSYASSMISHGISVGIPLENHPLQVVRAYISPLEKK